MNPHVTVIFDALAQRFLDSPRLQTFPFVASGPAATVDLQDLVFTTESFWATSGAIGLKANLARRLLINVNLRSR